MEEVYPQANQPCWGEEGLPALVLFWEVGFRSQDELKTQEGHEDLGELKSSAEAYLALGKLALGSPSVGELMQKWAL